MKPLTAEELARLRKDSEENERFERFLQQTPTPLTRDALADFLKKLGNGKWRVEFDRRLSRFHEQVKKSDLNEDRLKFALAITLVQKQELKSCLAGLEHFLDKVSETGGTREVLNREIQRMHEMDARKARDRKPEALQPADWTQPMTVASRRVPVDYVRATGQPRKRIEAFLRERGERPLAPEKGPRPAGRGRPPQLYGPKTNCAVLGRWLGHWCDQAPDSKAKIVLWQIVCLTRARGGERDVAAVHTILHDHLTVAPETCPRILKWRNGAGLCWLAPFHPSRNGQRLPSG